MQSYRWVYRDACCLSHTCRADIRPDLIPTPALKWPSRQNGDSAPSSSYRVTFTWWTHLAPFAEGKYPFNYFEESVVLCSRSPAVINSQNISFTIHYRITPAWIYMKIKFHLHQGVNEHMERWSNLIYSTSCLYNYTGRVGKGQLGSLFAWVSNL